jgi:hemerythrin-like domain-containing protein
LPLAACDDGHNISEHLAANDVSPEGGTMESVEILKREHRTVLVVVQAARRDLERFNTSREVAGDELERLLDFFRYFTNSCHDPKEEDLLFAALHRRGLSWDDFPLRELVREHQQMRVVLDSASDRLPLVRAGDVSAETLLMHDLQAYFDLLERHIVAEEAAIFPMAQELLTERDQEELGEAFAAIACEELEEGVHDYYAGLARDLAGAGTRA